MKKCLLTICCSVVFSFSAQAADISPYASIKGVYGWERAKLSSEAVFEKHFKTPGVNLAAGAKFQKEGSENAVRAELEYAYRAEGSEKYADLSDGDFGKQKFSVQTLMLNGYYDFSTGTVFKPYVGAGIGVAKTKFREQGVDVTDGEHLDSVSKTGFAWNIGAGVGIEVSDNIVLDIGYHYVDRRASKKSFVDYADGSVSTLKLKSSANEFSVGLRFDF